MSAVKMLNKADSKDALFFISSSITEPQQGTLTQRLKKRHSIQHV